MCNTKTIILPLPPVGLNSIAAINRLALLEYPILDYLYPSIRHTRNHQRVFHVCVFFFGVRVASFAHKLGPSFVTLRTAPWLSHSGVSTLKHDQLYPTFRAPTLGEGGLTKPLFQSNAIRLVFIRGGKLAHDFFCVIDTLECRAYARAHHMSMHKTNARTH